jgi:hypothetical protein
MIIEGKIIERGFISSHAVRYLTFTIKKGRNLINLISKIEISIKTIHALAFNI